MRVLCLTVIITLPKLDGVWSGHFREIIYHIVKDYNTVKHPCVPQIYNLQKFHTARTESTNNQLFLVFTSGILLALVFVERWTGALQVQSRFQTALIA